MQKLVIYRSKVARFCGRWWECIFANIVRKLGNCNNCFLIYFISEENSKFVRANPVYVVEVWPLILSRTNIAIATLKVHSNYLNCCNQSLKILMDNWVKRFSFLCFFHVVCSIKVFLLFTATIFNKKISSHPFSYFFPGISSCNKKDHQIQGTKKLGLKEKESLELEIGILILDFQVTWGPLAL